MSAVSLTGRVALITGSSSGIGEATLLQLAARGCDVVVHYHSNSEAAEIVAEAARSKGVRAIVFGGDIADPAIAQALVAATVAEFGRIDILVNNAGEWHFSPFGDTPIDHLRRQFDVSAIAVFNMIQLALPHFAGDWGAIVNVVSNLAIDPTVGTVAYGASRAAAMVMTSGLARELAGKGVSINAVAPGPTETKMALVRGTEERRRYVATRTPFGRYGMPTDIANVITFLASPEAHWVTGQTIMVDGGYTAGYY
jgi:3-oxoacyl-[acyl-carrier protein] reductase